MRPLQSAPATASPVALRGFKKTAFWIALALVFLVTVTVFGTLVSFIVQKTKGPAALDYEDLFGKDGEFYPGGALKPEIETRVVDGLGGTVRWKNNSQGFRSDAEYSPTPPPGTLRVMILGDSFVAGYRVDQAKCFGFLIEDRLRRILGRPVEVLIAHEGGGGCPASGFRYFSNLGAEFHPHVLVLGITLGNDIAQAYTALHPRGPFELETSQASPNLRVRENVPNPIGFRHGLEVLALPSFAMDGPGQGPRFGRLSHAAESLHRLLFPQAAHEAPQAIKSYYENFGMGKDRLFDPTNGLGMFLKAPPDEIRDARASLCRIISAFKVVCDFHGVSLVVALFPQRFQVQDGDWAETVRTYGLKRKAFDLLAPNKAIRDCCASRSIPLLDPTEAMSLFQRKAGKSLYLPCGDMHWNERGHETFAESAVKVLAGQEPNPLNDNRP